MHALRQEPLFRFDHATRKQIDESRQTIVEHLRDSPDDFKALVLADVFDELDPDRDRELAAHRARFVATRPANWRLRAQQLGLDRLLFHFANGMRSAKLAGRAISIFERRAADIADARSVGVVPGAIDATHVPAGLSASYHASGHLARVSVKISASCYGELALEPTPGRGWFTLVEKRGGYGTMIRDDYRDGEVVVTLNTPWHDGTESRERRSWTGWVDDCLDQLARIARIARK